MPVDYPTPQNPPLTIRELYPCPKSLQPLVDLPILPYSTISQSLGCIVDRSKSLEVVYYRILDIAEASRNRI